ncbi:GNAT family N-acetyltransferase [Ruminococcaceae bacterium OttesenSCG-928-D13]|nr:GNAT family N-acetyltransferase [Ruminococcaceae bacterium OttesenSCG-928-D13]
MSLCRLKNGDRMDILRADPADAAEILQFLGVAAGESDFLASSPEDFDLSVEQERAYLTNMAASPTSITLAGKVDGRVMAIASLNAASQQRCAHTCELSLLVAQACWGQGAGGALIEELLNHARETGTLKLVHLGVREDNQRAIELYHRYGFKVTGRLPGFFCVDGQYYDEILMALIL